ncbi:MAG: hypothetical protein ACRC78_24415, partial [Planktothrix sp.]
LSSIYLNLPKQFMVGFPYTYGDSLSEEEALTNFERFMDNYGPFLVFLVIAIASASVPLIAHGKAPVKAPVKVEDVGDKKGYFNYSRKVDPPPSVVPIKEGKQKGFFKGKGKTPPVAPAVPVPEPVPPRIDESTAFQICGWALLYGTCMAANFNNPVIYYSVIGAITVFLFGSGGKQ